MSIDAGQRELRVKELFDRYMECLERWWSATDAKAIDEIIKQRSEADVILSELSKEFDS